MLSINMRKSKVQKQLKCKSKTDKEYNIVKLAIHKKYLKDFARAWTHEHPDLLFSEEGGKGSEKKKKKIVRN